MPITIRRATIDDSPVIVEYNCLLAEESEGKRLDRSHVEPGVKALLTDPRKGRYFVAVVSGDDVVGQSPGVSDLPPPAPPYLQGGERIVGQMMHTFEWSDWRNGDIWWLQSVYVHRAFRRQGVFRALLRRLQSEAETDPTVVGLRMYVEDQNTRAHATYESLGFEMGGYFVMERMIRRSDLHP